MGNKLVVYTQLPDWPWAGGWTGIGQAIVNVDRATCEPIYSIVISGHLHHDLSTFQTLRPTLLTSDSAFGPTRLASPQAGAIATNSLQPPYCFQCIAVGCLCSGSTPHHPILPDATSFELSVPPEGTTGHTT